MRIFLFTVLLLCFSFPALADEEGYASWYGGKFQGRMTANGEIFDTEKFTAAHKTLAFGTMVKVTNLENGKSTIVRINDRGPFVKDRIIDLSRIAAWEIDLQDAGVARVKVEIIGQSTPAPQKIKYIIQVGSYSRAENAYNIRKLLEEKGLKITFEKTESNFIRVLVTDIISNELDKTKSLLSELHFTGLLVKKLIIE